jgi:hypothetical protein
MKTVPSATDGALAHADRAFAAAGLRRPQLGDRGGRGELGQFGRLERLLVLVGAEPALDGGAAGQRDHAGQTTKRVHGRSLALGLHQMRFSGRVGLPPTWMSLSSTTRRCGIATSSLRQRLRVGRAGIVGALEREQAHRRALRAPRRRRLVAEERECILRLAIVDEQARQARLQHGVDGRVLGLHGAQRGDGAVVRQRSTCFFASCIAASAA